MVIAITSQKGGVGKSTLAIGIAACLSGRLVQAALVDADPQATATDWARRRDEPPFPVVSATDPGKLSSQVAALAAEHDHVVIDGPPRSEALSRAAIIAADVVLIPVEPSGASDWACATTVSQVREAHAIQPGLRAALVLSRVLSRTVIARDIREHLAEHDVPLLRSEVGSRVQLAEAMTVGKTIFEWAPRSRAASEIAALTKELARLAKKG